MSGIGVLIPIALLLGLSGLAAFMWSLSHGQFDDLEGAGERILIDDEGDGPAKGPVRPVTSGGAGRNRDSTSVEQTLDRS